MPYVFPSGVPLRTGPDGKLLGGTYYPPGQEPQPAEVEADPERAKAVANALGMPWMANAIDSVSAGNMPFSSNVNILNPNSPAPGASTATVGEATSDDGFIDAGITSKAFEILNMVRGLGRQGGSLPLPNELEEFASMNCIFGLGCISPQELNFPDKTYRVNGVRYGQVALKSGQGAARGKPRIYAEQQYGIDTDYYIDDVSIDTVIAPNPRSRATNFFNIQFKVFEPYSMGLFLQTLQKCARNAGYSNYLEAPWLLTLEFVGFDNDGNPISKPGLRKLLPLKLVTIAFDVDERGSHYSCTCSAFNDEAFTDTNQGITQTLTISGQNLKEMCQTGINSLATHINTLLLKEKEANKVKHEIDEYIIAFPADNSSSSFASNLFTSSIGDTATTGELQIKEFTDEQIAEAIESAGANASGFSGAPDRIAGSITNQKRAFVEGRLGYSVQRGNLSQGIKRILAGNDAPSNKIANAPIDPGTPLGHGASPFGLANFAYNEENGLLERAGTVVDPKLRTVQFKTGTKIQKIIEDLILMSDYGKLIANQLRDTSKTMIDWFRIESQIYVVHDPAAERVIGRHPRIYLYRVVPYQVHRSVFQMPNSAPPGYDQLYAQAAKEYNYIYTGQNKDVLGFEIKFDNAFYKAIASDTGNNSASNDPAVSGTTDQPVPLELQGNENTAQGDGTTVVRENVDRGDNESASAIAESPDLRTARAFNNAVVNSDADLITIDLEILGDPYFIADSGVGNFNSDSTMFMNINAAGGINYQTSEVDIIINFRTPVDLDTETGQYRMDGTTLGVDDFSGLYKVNTVTNTISGNVFKQTLQCVRRPNQQIVTPATVTAEPTVAEESAYDKRVREAREAGVSGDALEFIIADVNGDGRLQYWEVPDQDRAQQLTRGRNNTNPDGTQPTTSTTGSYDEVGLDAFGGAGEPVTTTETTTENPTNQTVPDVVEGITDAVGSVAGSIRDLYYKYGGGRSE